MFDTTTECTPTAFVAIYGTPGLGRQLLSFFTVFQKPYFDPGAAPQLRGSKVPPQLMSPKVTKFIKILI